MKKPVIVSIILGTLMVSSGVLTKVVTSNVIYSDRQAEFNLETMIPREFNGWKIDSSAAGLIVNPSVKREIDRLYSQTLARSYINNEGERIMLAIAYGGIQKTTDMHAHRPEICYSAGGFEISKMTKTFVDTAIGRIPVMHLVAQQGARNEPITYWIRVGDSLTRGWFEQKLTSIRYGLTGKVPDGVLVRVSAISDGEQDSYRIQQLFLSAMLQAVRREDRHWLVGKLAH
jgi:EpsI family protein